MDNALIETILVFFGIFSFLLLVMIIALVSSRKKYTNCGKKSNPTGMSGTVYTQYFCESCRKYVKKTYLQSEKRTDC